VKAERDRESEREPDLSKPNPSPNSFHKLCEWFSGRFLFESKILVKSPKPRDKAQRKVDYDAITIRRNYDTKLSASISMTQKMWEL
jgi:hypothetical protein